MVSNAALHERPGTTHLEDFGTDTHQTTSPYEFFFLGNIIWAICFGWILCLLYCIAATLLFISGNVELSFRLMNLSSYLFWPFGKFIQVEHENFMHGQGELHEESMVSLLSSTNERRAVGSANIFKSESIYSLKRLIFLGVFFLIIGPVQFIITCLCWLSISFIPMAKFNWVILNHVYLHPERLAARGGSEYYLQQNITAEILLCVFKASGMQYFKYTVDGVNVVILNFIVFVMFTIIDGFFIAPAIDYTGIGSPWFVFTIGILSILPLAYYIGMAISSLSAQTSFGVGAALNASFGSFAEILLYAIAIASGKVLLVEGAIIGTFLCCLLLLPGLSMIASSFSKYASNKRIQRFNAKSMNVSSTMLIMAMIGAFTPTLFYNIYGKVP